MSDSLGTITVPNLDAPTGTFPIPVDFPVSTIDDPEYYVHRFGLYDAKAEQRYYAGPRARIFAVRRAAMSQSQRQALETFWLTNQGALGAFTFNAPNLDQTTTAYTCRFANDSITYKQMAAALCSVE